MDACRLGIISSRLCCVRCYLLPKRKRFSKVYCPVDNEHIINFDVCKTCLIPLVSCRVKGNLVVSV